MKRLLLLVLILAGCGGSAPGGPAVAATPFVAPTIGPTLAPLGGTGVVTFGAASALDNETLLINPSKDSFKVSTKSIAWSANLSEPAGATSLTWILARVAKGGSETIIFRQEVDVSNPTFDLLANSGDLSLLVNRRAGTYVMRYLRDAEILAEGKFTLTK